MAENEAPETDEVEQSYLNVVPTAPRRWLLVVGAFVVLSAFAATFFGLYTINRGASPTLTPDPVKLTEGAAVVAVPLETAPGSMPDRPTSTITPSAHFTVTVTAVSPTYTVQQGDTLIGIAQQLSVSADALQALNQISGEAIFPNQVLLVPPTVTPGPEPGLFVHRVAQGEALISIAAVYKVSVDEIKALNGLRSDTIVVGQKILIPQGGVRPATPTPSPTPEQAWQPSILEGDLEAAYPLSITGDRFDVHYQPDTPAARAPEHMAKRVKDALQHIEDTLEVSLEDKFDVYIAGSLFASDNQALRGRTFSSERKSFLLSDGSGTPEERQYILTHELTHLVARNTLGHPSSVMLHEGLAVYTGIDAMEAAGFLPLNQFCAAYQQASKLPSLSDSRAYLGHIRDLDLYFASGCFVDYLLDEHTLFDFKRLWSSGDYLRVYGKTRSQLEDDWLAALQAEADGLTVDPDDLVNAVDAVTAAYDLLFSDFGGTPVQMQAYGELDQARIALLQGRLESSAEHLATFHELLPQE